MKLRLRHLTIFVGTVLAVLAYEFFWRGAPPSLRITNPVVDLDTVQVGDVFFQSFEFENIGGREITVSGGTTPCPGVFEERKPIVIAPRVKQQIKIGLLIRESAISDIPHSYRYTVETNDPAARRMELRLVAHCQRR